MMLSCKYPALSHRVVTGRSNPIYTESYKVTDTFTRPCHYRQWSSVNMQNAMVAVEKGETIRIAAEKFGVPRSSLHDRVTGKIQHGNQAGRVPYLTKEEEELVKFLIKCADIGYPHTRNQALALVQHIINQKGIQRMVTFGWWQKFCQRHETLSLRSAASLSVQRAMASDPDALKLYYDTLEDTLKGNGILNKPMHIFNCDETGMPLNPKNPKVIAKKGSKNPSSISGDTKTQITVLACVSANGYSIPPFVIFDRKTLNPELTLGEVPGTLYGLSENGWITSDLFYHWFNSHFLAYAPKSRPLLLLMDGHSTHYCPEAIRIAAKEKVILYTLPPNTTHLLQPLDKGCFGPLKVSWTKVCHDFYTNHTGRVITRYDFSTLFAKAWFQSMTAPNIIAGFRTCGVCPFSRNVIPVSKSEFKPELLAKDTGLAYIPLYSPARICEDDNDACTSSSNNDASIISEEDLYHSPFPSFSLERSLSEGNIDQSNCFSYSYHSSSINNLLKTPSHPSKNPKARQGPSAAGKVLTSVENLQMIAEKEKMKQIALQQKEEKKAAKEKQKEEKKAAKEKQKEEKKTTKEKQKEERDAKEKAKAGKSAKSGAYKLKKALVTDTMKDDKTKCLDTDQESRDDYESRADYDCEITKVDCPLSKVTSRLQRIESHVKQKAKRVKSIKSLNFSQKFLEEIKSGKWLNDNHIKAISDLLIHQFPTIPGLYDPKYGEDLSYPPTDDGFVQILHYENHWLTVYGKTAGLVKVYDSLNSAVSSSIKTQIASIAHCQAHSITLEIQNTQLQKGHDDCALYAIAYATDLCFGNDPADLRYYQDKLRDHLIECLKQKKIVPFPSRPRRHIKPVIEFIEVYCTCRLPETIANEDMHMVACDACDEWYHDYCEDISPEMYASPESIWLCNKCSASKHRN